ncbi:rRNA maturation RNase YbeY [Jannaschia sp. 2305UL9-9]|uniref:rRNA maturation RNase YbeY n=1 Tax=Jannaschia sp. 2305UL9-9 TaxID=3121638 RepID=UPI0035276EE5
MSDAAEAIATIDVIAEDPRWSDLQRLSAVAVPAALDGAGVGQGWEVAILGCDDARIATLNADFRGKPKPTNVLSWPSDERGAETPGGAPLAPDPEDPELGDIAIAYDTCAREAGEQGKTFDAHVTHLLVHAVLHLLGYDHETDDDAMRMESLEVRIVTALGLPDPYDDA